MKTSRLNERGQTILAMLLSLTVLLGFVALATDVGILFYAKRQLQSIADSAAIGGASVVNCASESGNGTLTSGCPSVIMSAQIDAQGGCVSSTCTSAANGTNGATLANGVVLTVHTPPVDGPHSGDANYVETIACQETPVFFLNLFAPTKNTCTSTGGTTWNGKMPITARAVAYWGASQTCIAALGSSGTDISVTTSGSNPTLDAPQCGISVDSSSSSALTVTSSGSSTPIVAESIGIVGGYSETGGTVSPTPVDGIVPVSNPLAYLQPPTEGTCQPTSSFVASGGTLSIPQGSYCSGLSITASGTTVNFASGTYYIGGSGLSVVGSGDTFNGTGVTFYIAAGSVNFTASGSTYDFTAPTSGTYNGILFYQSTSDSSSATITESGTDSIFEGVLYFPDAALNFTASGSSTSLYLAFVVNSLNITTSSTTIYDYASLYGTSPIGTAVLVE